MLFQICHFCFTRGPKVTTKQTGTMVTVEAECHMCGEIYKWQSQPFMMGSFPAGNLLLRFGMLTAWASVRKVLLVLKHMGVWVFHEPTYYYHQRHFLIPSIVKYWRSYQAKMFESLRGKDVVLAGDGCHDSVGHSAKYGTYTVFCCTVGLILHFTLVQVNVSM